MNTPTDLDVRDSLERSMHRNADLWRRLADYKKPKELQMSEKSIEQVAYENIRAKALYHDLWQHVRHVKLKDTDRIYFRGDPEISQYIGGLLTVGSFQSSPVSRKHKKVLDIFGLSPILHMSSYRERSRPSLQVTFTEPVLTAFPGVGEKAYFVYGDMDIDLANWMTDLWGALVHFFEIRIPGPTSHVKLRKKLLKDDRVKRFLV